MSFDRFRAMASSTARNCLSNSSRRVVFFEEADEFGWLELFDDAAGALASDASGGERFFGASAEIKQSV